MRMTRIIPILGLVTIALSAIAHAELLVTEFAPLRGELTHRRDNDFSGDLDGTLKKQRRAVTKAIRFLDKNSTTLKKDAATAGKTQAVLLRVYGDEFAAESKIESLGGVFASLFDDLRTELQSRLDALVGGIGTISGGAAKRAQEQADKLSAALLDYDTSVNNPKLRAKAIKKAAGAAFKGQKTVDKALGPVKGIRATLQRGFIDPVPFASEFAQIEFYTENSALQIFARHTIPSVNNDQETIRIVIGGVIGPGAYSLTDPTRDIEASFEFRSGRAGSQPVRFDLVSGTVTVTRLDTGNKPRLVATFEYETSHATDGVRTVTAGRIDIVDDAVNDAFVMDDAYPFVTSTK